MHDARLYIAGQWVDGVSVEQVTDKYTNEPVTTLHVASRTHVDQALAALAEGQSAARWTAYERYEILARASRLLALRRDVVAPAIVSDSGFTITDARREVDRAVQTLLLSAEEAKRLVGEVVPINASPDASDRVAFTTLHPVGVVCAITPFNSPLNTVLHKVAPAIAAGNAVVLKPASMTPMTAQLVVELLLEAGVPADLLALVHGGGSSAGEWLLLSQVPAFYAFTGSTAVGEHIHKTIGLRRAQLEMGSLSSTIVCDDAELDRCLSLCVNAAFRKAGQVCTSVQRLYVHRSVLDDFVARMLGILRTRRSGDPKLEDTFVGPLISPSEAKRVGSWICQAANAGAKILIGGGYRDAVVDPTVLSDVTPDMRVMREEVFGPVVVIRGFDDLDQVIDEANDTPYGLSSGIFTRDIEKALNAARRLRMGSVHINETSSSRVDLMPYTGVKASGIGREGPYWAVREMSEQRLVTIGKP